MTESQKLSNFMDAIHIEAEKRQQKINQETETFKKAELAKIKAQARAEVYEIIRAQTEDIMVSVGKTVSAHKQENKRKLLQKRNEMVEDIFSEVEHRILVFVATQGYLSKVEQDIKSVQDKLNGSITVLLKSGDKSAQLCKELLPDAEIQTDTSIRLGGIIIVLNDEKKRLDFTFDRMLEAEKERFRETDGLKISI